MKRVSTILPLVALAAIALGNLRCQPGEEAFAQQDPLGNDVLTEPVLFAPGVISTGDYELNATFTPDNRTVFFTKSTPDVGFSLMTIATSTFDGGTWQTPQVAPFSGQYSEVDPFVSPDGSRIFYISQRPVDGTEPRSDYDIWYADRTGTGWGAPQHLDAPVNTDGQEYFPAVTTDGTLFFSSRREGSKNGSFDLYRAPLVDGNYEEPQNLGDAVNTDSHEIDVYVDPQERFVIFVSYRQGGQGRGDLYISYHRDGQWTEATNLGDKVNSPAREYCPSVSPDGRYLFFTSERGFADTPQPRPLTYDELTEHIRAPGNGMGDIYRISLSALGIEQ